MNLLPIADKLEAMGYGTQGVDLFINSFPASASQGILLRTRPSGVMLQHDLPGYLKFDFQMIVRSKNYEPGYALATSCCKSLNLKLTTLGSWHVNYIRPSNVPTAFPLSDVGVMEFNVNFEVCIVDPAWA